MECPWCPCQGPAGEAAATAAQDSSCTRSSSGGANKQHLTCLAGQPAAHAACSTAPAYLCLATANQDCRSNAALWCMPSKMVWCMPSTMADGLCVHSPSHFANNCRAVAWPGKTHANIITACSRKIVAVLAGCYPSLANCAVLLLVCRAAVSPHQHSCASQPSWALRLQETSSLPPVWCTK